jgi:hypothetical protein
MTPKPSHNKLSYNTRRLSHLDIEGGGQIVVSDGYAYVGHMKPPHGTSIIEWTTCPGGRQCRHVN